MQHTSIGSSSIHRRDIDGMRAIAVTAVVFFHANFSPFSSGYMGVDIFFVISGYLIGGIVIREVSAYKFSLFNFYARRCRRILPALIFVVSISCLVGWFVLGAMEFRALGATALSALLAMSNISFWNHQDYFAQDSNLTPLLMTWTLGVEEQFYLFFPFVIIAIMRTARQHVTKFLLAIALVSFCLSLWATWNHPAAAFYLLPFRAWELCVGAILASWENSRSNWAPYFSGPSEQAMGLIGLALVVLSVTGFDATTPFPGFVAALPVCGASLLILARRSIVNRRILGARLAVFIGAISYSWYLWHWPMLSYLRIFTFNEPSVLELIACVLISFAVAILSWRFVEQPFRKATRPAIPILVRYSAAIGLALIFPIAIKYSNGFSQRLGPEARVIEDTVMAGRGNCFAIFEDPTPDLSANCVHSVANRPTIALIGDSHAAALGFGLRQVASRKNLGLEIFTKTQCSPLITVTTFSPTQPQLARSCMAYMASAFDRVIADPNVSVVVLAAAWPPFSEKGGGPRYVDEHFSGGPAEQPALLEGGLKRTLEKLKRAGKRALVVGDVPKWRCDPVLVSFAESIATRREIATLLQSTAQNDRPERGCFDAEPRDPRTVELVKRIASEYGAQYVDLYDKFCEHDKCRFTNAGDLLFIDSNHLSNRGSSFAWEALGSALAQ